MGADLRKQQKSRALHIIVTITFGTHLHMSLLITSSSSRLARIGSDC
jgi:hypothetical protein